MPLTIEVLREQGEPGRAVFEAVPRGGELISFENQRWRVQEVIHYSDALSPGDFQAAIRVTRVSDDAG